MTDKGNSKGLPLDNNVRLVLYDAVALSEPGQNSRPHFLAESELFERAIGRLKILFPRELHVAGREEYFREKLLSSVSDGVLQRTGDDLLTLGPRPPKIQFPDGTIHDYPAGLEPAKQRLAADDARLANSGFDVMRLVPSFAGKTRSPEFQRLLSSIRLHGYQRNALVLEGADGTVIDGRARLAAATILKVKPATRNDVGLARWRDTPTQRFSLGLDLNTDRLTDDDVAHARVEFARRVERPWDAIAKDLELTREWRLTKPKSYNLDFPVEGRALRPGAPEQIVVSADGTKVGLKSLVLASGLPPHHYEKFSDRIHTERRKTALTGTRQALFVDVADALGVAEEICRHDLDRGKQVDPGWASLREWLRGQAAALG
jgi:hypothetical protein